MRKWTLALFAAAVLAPSAASAQAPDPYGPPETVPYGVPETVPPAPVYPPPVYAPPPAPAYPPPRVYAPPPPPAAVIQVPYYVYPAPAPVYVYPPPAVAYRPRLSCPTCYMRPAPRKWDGVRRFSLGVHGMVLGLNQQVGKDNVVLYGGGIQFRVRGHGRWGFEMAQSFLGNDWWDGNFSRRSYPFQMSLMLYLMPNTPDRIFNLYGLAGLGGMYDSISLRDENRNMVTQNFWEWEFHGGVGMELKYKWFAIEGDVRAHGFILDDDSAPAKYYRGVSGGPVPSSTYGFSGNVFLSAWF
jgi:hypothetical protein